MCGRKYNEPEEPFRNGSSAVIDSDDKNKWNVQLREFCYIAKYKVELMKYKILQDL